MGIYTKKVLDKSLKMPYNLFHNVYNGVTKMSEKSKAGRKKQYANSAERQKAYRLRKKQEKNSAELRLNIEKSSKMRLDRISKYMGISGADLIELLLKKEEDLILSKMSRMSEPLDKYLNI